MAKAGGSAFTSRKIMEDASTIGKVIHTTSESYRLLLDSAIEQ